MPQDCKRQPDMVTSTCGLTTRTSVVRRREPEAFSGAARRTPGLRGLVTLGSSGCLFLWCIMKIEIGGREVLIDEEDFDRIFSSHFTWGINPNSKKHWSAYVRGRKKTRDREQIYLHRFIMSPPIGMQVDHINGNGLDNRKENLRICTASQNTKNKRLAINNTVGLKGVTRRQNGKYVAQIRKDYKLETIGTFDSPEEAHEAYCLRAIELFGEFARFR